jgi:hypothetical protein
MGEVIPFIPRTAPKLAETLEQQAVNIIGGLSLDTTPETLLTFYESSLGFVPSEYVAPDEDGA